MEKVLYLTDTNTGGVLSKTALEVLGGAVQFVKELGDAQLQIGLFGENTQNAADSIARAGAAHFYGISAPEFSTSRYATDVLAVETLAKKSGASLIIAPAGMRMSRALPGAAHRLNGRIDTHVSSLWVVDGKPVIQRWYYRQRMVASLSREQRPWILLLDSGVFNPIENITGTASVEEITVSVADDLKRTVTKGLEAASTDAQTIRPDADLLFVAGAGWTKKQQDGQIHIKEAEKHILEFLNATQASLGSSKSLVDQGSEGEEVLPFMSHLNQVGQTGSTPRHPRGLATCCHGEEPHVVGWRFINDRRAVNTDPGCGWAQGKADVLYVADAFAVLKRINALLQQ